MAFGSTFGLLSDFLITFDCRITRLVLNSFLFFLCAVNIGMVGSLTYGEGNCIANMAHSSSKLSSDANNMLALEFGQLNFAFVTLS